MRSAGFLLTAALFFLAAAGCSGAQSTTEARNDPAAVQGRQQAVLRGTAMRESSAMGLDMVETLEAATRSTRTEARGTPLPRFNTLLAALDAAGLSDLLRQEGPFTLFAPTDDAFRRLAPSRLEMLLDPANREELRALLRRHIVEGNFVADELAQRSPVTTLGGNTLVVRGEDQDITVAGTRVRQADAGVVNGTIHVLDRVLVPDETQ